MKMMKKSMISAVTAAVLVAGFTGCSSDTTNITEPSTSTSTTSGNNDTISTPKGTVTGTVMDTNGNPISNVKVGLAGMSATTDASGIYVFNEVPVINTASSVGLLANQTRHNPLQVTITAPDGYMGATVTVTPEAQQISSGDPSVTDVSQTNPNTNFIDGYLAQAGTAVLPKLGAIVTGRLELQASEASVANTNIALDFRFVGGIVGGNVAQTQNGVTTTYATSNYNTTTDADGFFRFENLPADSSLQYVVGNYVVIGEQVLQGGNVLSVSTGLENDVINVGDVQVSPVVNNDTTAPMVVSVSEGLTVDLATTPLDNQNRMMLVDDARTEFTLNFSENIDVDSDGSDLPDADMTDSVTVYVGATVATMQKVDATAEYNASSLKIILATAPASGDLINVHLVNADFRDMANNPLGLNANIGYDSIDIAPAVTTQVRLQSFADLNLNAVAVENEAQMEKDTIGVEVDPALNPSREYSNAFNDANLPVAGIQQLNSAETTARLNNLTIAQGFGIVVVNNTARITFEPSNAASFRITRADGANINLDAVNTVNVNTIIGAGTPAVTITVNDNSAVELVLNAVAIDDVMVITPMDDLNYAGTPKNITLKDNVPATTVLQNSYINGAGVTGRVVQPFGNGGELTNDFGESLIGTPVVALTPGLLDNLDATGNNILDNNIVTQGDNRLTQELFVHNGRNVADTARVIPEGLGIYDATAFIEFSANLERKVGISFSENIDLTGVQPTYNGANIDMTSFVANNDVTVDDNGVPQNEDLALFQTADVMALSNNNELKVLSFDGILDASGNVASNADVVLEDHMPPFIVKSYYTGDLVIEYNEAITSPATRLVSVNVTDNVGLVSTIVVSGANAANWSLSADAKTLTIDSAMIPAGLRPLFNFGSYVESVYSDVEGYNSVDGNGHAALDADAQDLHGNTWASWAVERDVAGNVDMPIFASVDMIGEFTVTEQSVKFNIGDDANVVTQEIVWNFSHPIRADEGGDFAAGQVFFDADNAGVTYDAVTGIFTANSTAIGDAWDGAATDLYAHELGGDTHAAGDFSGAITDTGDTFMRLSDDKKSLTFTFKTNVGATIVAGDNVEFSGTTASQTAFKSALTEDEKTVLSASPTN